MSTLADQVDIVIGVDTHRAAIVASSPDTPSLPDEPTVWIPVGGSGAHSEFLSPRWRPTLSSRHRGDGPFPGFVSSPGKS